MKKLKMRDSKGSITLYVLIAVMFFAIILTLAYVSAMNKAQSQEDQVQIIKDNYDKNIGNEEDIYEIALKEIPDTAIEDAEQAMPDGGEILEDTSEEIGIVMVDSNENEWVWIEVPAEVFTTAENSTDYDAIKADLIEYAKDYRDDWVDEWYDGCGLTQSQYTTAYQTMLGSIYKNKGFYISRYEAGIAGSNENVNLARTDTSERITEDTIETLPEAVSKKDMIPYNYVYCSEAQMLASNMATDDKNCSLLFGIQWDLVCKFLETKGNWDTTTNTAQYYINENSTSWGNYYDSSVTLISGKYNIDGTTWTSYNVDTEDYVIDEKTVSNNAILLTTGASNDTKKMNIYDFAGNEEEWTLEQVTGQADFHCSSRGGYYIHNENGYPVSGRSYYNTIEKQIGFRATLY